MIDCAGRERPDVDLRLDVLAHDAVVRLEAGHVDLVVEVADVAEDRLVLHPRHLVDGDDVLVAGRGDHDVGDVEDVLEGGDLVAVHGGLQRADRVDLGDHDPGALATEALGAALADVAVAADDRDLAADEHVGGAVDAVDQAVAAAVLVVELRLGDRVVDVDGREEQRAFLHHVVEAVHAGGGLLGDTARARRRPWSSGRCLLERLHAGRRRRPSARGWRRWPGRAPRPSSRPRHRGGRASWRRHRRRGSCWPWRHRATAGSAGCTTSTPPASRPSRRRPARPAGRRRCRSARRRRRRLRGPGWRRCCRRPSAPRRRARRGSR